MHRRGCGPSVATSEAVRRLRVRGARHRLGLGLDVDPAAAVPPLMRALVTTAATTVRRIAIRLSPAPRDDGGEREGGGEEGAADHRCERGHDRPGCLVAGPRDDAGEEEHERCGRDRDEDPGDARAPPRYHLDRRVATRTLGALPDAMRVLREESRLIAPPRPERLKSRPCPRLGGAVIHTPGECPRPREEADADDGSSPRESGTSPWIPEHSRDARAPPHPHHRSLNPTRHLNPPASPSPSQVRRRAGGVRREAGVPRRHRRGSVIHARGETDKDEETCRGR